MRMGRKDGEGDGSEVRIGKCVLVYKSLIIITTFIVATVI